MAEVRYVVIDYSDEDYLEVGSDVGYFEFEYVQNGYVASVVSGAATLTSAFSQTSTGIRAKITTADLVSTATLDSTGVKCRIGNFSETNTFSLTATALQLIPAELTAFNSISLAATAVKVFGADATINSNSTVAVTALKIRPGAAVFSAFNTVVSAAGRIRPAVDITALAATLTASPTKVFGASTNTFATYDATPFPITGVVAEHADPDSFSGLQLNYRTYTASTDAETFDDIVVAWYAKSYNSAAGTIFSWSGDGLNLGPIAIRMSETSISIGPNFGITWNNIPDTRELHHYAMAFIDRYTGSVELYIDGVRHTNKTGAYGPPDGEDWYGNPRSTLSIGRFKTIVNFGYPGGPNDYRVVQSDPWDGELAQVWVGVPYGATQFNRITGYTRSTFQSFGPYGNLSDSQQITIGMDSTGTGRGTDSTLSQPGFYAEYSDADIGEYLSGTLNKLYYAAYPLQGNFTLTPTAFKLVYGEAALTSAFSIVGVLGKLQPSSIAVDSASTLSATAYDFTKASATLNTEATLSADAYEFTKASAALSAEFSLTPDADETSTGVSLVLATATMTVDAGMIRRTSVTMLSTVECSGDATTNQLGRCLITSTATLSATPYDFTKGIVSASAVLTIEATARIFSPPRGTLLSGMQATLVATPLKLRIQTSAMQSSASFVVATGGALRRGSITMSAFDTVLSAGKVIEFLAENTIAVTEEQRLLRVALESTVLLVQMANGVNTITAETTDIVVPQEQGRLLVQYNQPTN